MSDRLRFSRIAWLGCLVLVCVVSCDEHTTAASDLAAAEEQPYEIISQEEAEKRFGIERPEPPPEEIVYPDPLQPLVARAKAGDASAQYELAQELRKGMLPGQVWMVHDESPRGARTNYDRLKNHFEVTRWFKEAAAKGHPGAQYELGMRYLEGWGVAPSFKEAEPLLRAAEEGEWEEAEFIGAFLDAVKDDDEAKGDQALPHAMWLYENGKREEALEEFVALTEGDDKVDATVAAYFAGRINDWGYEAARTETLEDQAIKWYRRAADGGYVWAQLGLGDLYYTFCDDVDEARFWYRAAASQHSAEARQKLADLDDPVWGSCVDWTKQNQGTSACERIPGEWQWRTADIPGVLTFLAGNQVNASAAQNSPPLLQGSWSCDAATSNVVIRWPNGVVETLEITSDASSIGGSNNFGSPVSGTRLQRVPQRGQTPSWDTL